MPRGSRANRRGERRRNLEKEAKVFENTKKETCAIMANLPEFNGSFQKNAKRIAAWYIDTTENLAKESLSLHEKSTVWAKNTPLAAIFEAQNSMAQQFVENYAGFARKLFQLDSQDEISE
jgi:hypothetical protein